MFDSNLTIAQRLLALLLQVDNDEQKELGIRIFAELPIPPKFKQGDIVIVEVHRDTLATLLNINPDTLEYWSNVQVPVLKDVFYGTEVNTPIGRYNVTTGRVSTNKKDKKAFIYPFQKEELINTTSETE